MLTDPQLRFKINSLWDKLWSGGLSNPLDAIEQLSFLLFLKQLDEREQDAERAEAELAELQSRIAPLEQEINQLTRQFWVNKDQVVAQKYDLSASRYRQVEHEEVFYEQPAITLERMRQLENVAGTELRSLLSSLPGGKQT